MLGSEAFSLFFLSPCVVCQMGVTLANTPYEEVLVHSNMFSVTASPDVSPINQSTSKCIYRDTLPDTCVPPLSLPNVRHQT